MPMYCYTCDVCGLNAEELRPMADSDKPMTCVCGQKMRRDYGAEKHGMSGELPEWTSVNAGVNPDQVAECNQMYAHLGVRFDPKNGNAIVPGNNRRRFLKERGVDELHDAPKRRGGCKRYRVIDGKVTQVA